MLKKPASSSNLPSKTVFCLPSLKSLDQGKVRLGGQAPAFRKLSIKDEGKVRLGGQGPLFR